MHGPAKSQQKEEKSSVVFSPSLAVCIGGSSRILVVALNIIAENRVEISRRALFHSQEFVSGKISTREGKLSSGALRNEKRIEMK